MTRHFATYSDAAYLPRLKALYASMQRHCGDFELHVLAWDGDVFEWATKATGLSVCHVGGFLITHPELSIEALPGPRRSRVEHMWTVGPAFCQQVMEGTGQPVTYVDADVWFMAPPDDLFREAKGKPAAFCGHNFARDADRQPGPTWESHAGLFGEINCGLLVFNDIAVAREWAELCRQWCYDRPDGVRDVGGRLVAERYGDQLYLDHLVRDGKAVAVKDPSIMAGPWNIHSRPLRKAHDGTVFFGGKPLVSYHFSGLRLGPHGQWSPSRPEYQISDAQIEALYVPYLRALEEASR